MALLADQVVVNTGLTPAYTAAATGGDTMATGPRRFLHVKNGGTAPITVTVDSVQPCSQGGDHNVAVVVPNGSERMIGPIDERFAQTATGLANITYTGTATVTVAALVGP